jgi:hypothetical protein
MNDEQRHAYEWAKKQNFQSVAAQYAKLLSEAIDALQTENQQLRANSMIQESIITGGRNPDDKERIIHLLMVNSALESHKFTLKKALELAVPSENDRLCYLQQAQKQERNS